MDLGRSPGSRAWLQTGACATFVLLVASAAVGCKGKAAVKPVVGCDIAGTAYVARRAAQLDASGDKLLAYAGAVTGLCVKRQWPESVRICIQDAADTTADDACVEYAERVRINDALQQRKSQLASQAAPSPSPSP